MEFTYRLHDIDSSAARFIEAAGNRRVFAFEGDMGAGKTTFIRAICGVLGVEGRISSPSFAIINEYISPGVDKIYHIDLYRLRGAEDARMAGVEDALLSGNYCFLEWPGIARELLPEETILVTIKTIGPDERKLVFNL